MQRVVYVYNGIGSEPVVRGIDFDYSDGTVDTGEFLRVRVVAEPRNGIYAMKPEVAVFHAARRGYAGP